MAKYLVVVESPAKAKTIEKYLGADYRVLASYGHVRDLLPKKNAVDPDNHFAMTYVPIERNEAHVQALAKAMKACQRLYLATDPDREGEAIAWHVLTLLRDAGALAGDKPVERIVFHQITKRAVQEALNAPREISMDLVNAQQARRALDYLVGFQLSPVLWKKVRRGLSAGRVQSPALRLIAERETEIEQFQTQEYWTFHADVLAKKQGFPARLTYYEGKKVEQFDVTTEALANTWMTAIEKAAKGHLTVSAVQPSARKRHPAAPFITSTLQQEAARKLGFSAQRTMQVAQQLYEGVDVGEGPTGLITYMRTDSVTLASEAIQEIRAYIEQVYGSALLPPSPRMYKTKSKNAQEAHEAVRPTSVLRAPDQLKSYLTTEQWKLYRLIWQRTVACQMLEATLNMMAIDLVAGPHTFRANGTQVAVPGFLLLYEEGRDDTPTESDEAYLPALTVGQVVDVTAFHPEQHFTEPPPRYTEASLVKALEEYDIGRPSTYASIIATLKNRQYVELEQKRFRATDVGRIVNRFLTQYFTQYVDYGFTANLEDELDAVSRGDKEWVPLLEHFWQPFKTQVDEITEHVKRSDVTQEKLDEPCPECGKHLVIRLGQGGRFIGCSAYPDCAYTRDMGTTSAETPDNAAAEGRFCPKCSAQLVVKRGRFGPFLGCSKYPDCKHIESIKQLKKTGVKCDTCGKGEMIERQFRGRSFYACSEYPDCRHAMSHEPIAETCPACQSPVLVLRRTKRFGVEKMCPKKTCDYRQQIAKTLDEG
ncbi:MAG: DNA topoisomerase I [Gammaproteobacteria bacterium RIFCSPHIGHO2_12_FULL_45_9]|nr:MAG: DNA topoisomerase I [Gammaproteobacteria bacterium RIFCSPHIGHO2_12_FULL_45_9]